MYVYICIILILYSLKKIHNSNSVQQEINHQPSHREHERHPDVSF